MSLGLSHSLSRHKLKFSTDKVDTMIIQAVSLLDDLDKELNIYAMRVKEWYGWHFPEMARIINDNLAYSRVILKMGMRASAANADLAEILPEEIEVAVKSAAEISMGTEITTEDLDNIQALAEQVISFTEFRSQLSSYLSARMTAIAPNLTALVGDLVGARLIAHAGSLMNLAKSPASTVQILGAEKALFRALKTKHDTPKYGLIYNASLIGQATGKHKGKIARMLATKATLGSRVDALADWSAEGEGKGDQVTEEERSALGVENRMKIERRLASLEGRPLRSKGVAIGPNGMSVVSGKWEIKEARKYNPDADGLAGDAPAAATSEAPGSRKTQSKALKLIEEVEEAKSKELPSSRSGTLEGDREENGVANGAAEDYSKTLVDDEKSDDKMDDADKDNEEGHELHAMQAGLSIKKYMRKLERGQIKFNTDGKAEYISKKAIHKAKKAAKKAADPKVTSRVDKREESEEKPVVPQGRTPKVEEVDEPSTAPPKKRKRDQEDVKATEKSERKKKRKSKA